MAKKLPQGGKLQILSLGAGVQSTALLLMACRGELKVDHAIFADTQGEPEPVYAHLAWLQTQAKTAGIPVHIVTSGDLGNNYLSTDKRSSSIPIYTKTIIEMTAVQRTELERLRELDLSWIEDEDIREEVERDLERLERLSESVGKAKAGQVMRQCTRDYKVRPVRKKAKELSDGYWVDMLMGISLDEAQRMRDSDVQWAKNVYPLIERRMTREDCLTWMAERGYPEPPKSACYFCPYTSNRRWQEMRDTDPATFARAVAFDAAVRHRPNLVGEAYLHRSLLALDVAPIGAPTKDGDPGIEQECIGMCGQ